MPAMAELIPDSLYWQPALAADGVVTGLADIHQAIRTILQTRKGTVPHRPEFGSNLHRYLDWPQDRVKPYLVREVRAAIHHPTEGEPRAEVIAVDVHHEIGHVRLMVSWCPVGSSAQELTEVGISR